MENGIIAHLLSMEAGHAEMDKPCSLGYRVRLDRKADRQLGGGATNA